VSKKFNDTQHGCLNTDSTSKLSRYAFRRIGTPIREAKGRTDRPTHFHLVLKLLFGAFAARLVCLYDMALSTGVSLTPYCVILSDRMLRLRDRTIWTK
jgi:hypothetical protein